MAPVIETSSPVYTLRRAHLHCSWVVDGGAIHGSDGFGEYDLQIDGGRITSIVPSGPAGADGDNNLRRRIVSPTFVDCHTHLDKGHIWPRRPNPDGSFPGALGAVGEDRTANWSANDLELRMEFGLKCAYAYGTGLMRTHLDSLSPQEDVSWPVFEAVRDRWAGRIELQASALLGIESVRDEDWFDALTGKVKSAGGVLGAVTYMVPDLVELLDRMFQAAMEYGLELDFHADETDDVDAISLKLIAEAAKRNGYKDRILIGHCCSLARQPDDEVLRTLDRVAATNISVVSLPMCNMYLQDRRHDSTTPRWRGVTLMHEMKARGINVCVASDNTRDPFYAYGDLDMLEVYRMATRTIHFDHPVADWPATAFSNAAKAMGTDRPHGILEVGQPADFIVFEGRSWTELLSRPESARVVVRNGAVIDRTIPAYEELDHLMG